MLKLVQLLLRSLDNLAFKVWMGKGSRYIGSFYLGL